MSTREKSRTSANKVEAKIFRLIGKGIREATKRVAIQKVYENMLWNQVKDGPIPEHIGIILDGNRRWAASRGLDPWKGHKQGAQKLEDFLDWCGDIKKIRTITVYVFSTENFKRSQKEILEIFRLLKEYLTGLLQDERIVKNEIRVKMLGRIHVLPQEFQDLIRSVEKKTEHYNRHFFNFAIAYGGRTEIIDAVRTIAREVKEGKLALERIDEKVIERHLYTAHLPQSNPDLIIRTSGEIRLSNFLTWQGAYSELCFVDVHWPDFRKLDLLRAIRMYQRRLRRFGA